MRKRLVIHSTAVVLLSACAPHASEWPIAFLGDPAPLAAATKTIEIRPDTKWVNVTGGDIVRFDVGSKSFAWAFNVATGVHSFELNRVAPPGILERQIKAYISPDPRYIGGNGSDFDN